MRLLRLWSLVVVTLLPVILAAGKPKVYRKEFDNLPKNLFYFEDSPVILVLDPHDHSVWRSNDDGETWKQVSEVKGVAYDIIEHPFDKEKAVIFTDGKEHWATKDKGSSWQKFKVELPPSQDRMAFSANNTDYALYFGSDCNLNDVLRISCKDKAYYTKDWFDSGLKILTENTHGCLFAHGNKIFHKASESTVLCVVDGSDKYSEHRKLLVSDNFFKDSTEPKLDGYNTVKGLVGIASVSKFLVAAVRSTGTDEMALYVSNDAENWDRAEFPHDQGGLKEGAYTILESTSYSIQVDVLTPSPLGAPIGELFTSNSNGTYFTRNLANTNRLSLGLVDFEQIQGIDGIVMANIVKNADEIRSNHKATKKLQSKISFDDGKMDTWKSLKAGDKDLHLYSVTDLVNGGRVYSSRAPGLVMGVGNTGDTLNDYDDGDLYISDNAGLTWQKTRDEAHKYEFGGSGSIIVAIYDEGYADKISYSKNYGKSWEDLDLGIDIRPQLLTTTPDSTSLKFLLVGKSKDKKTHIIGLSFSDVFDRECKLDKDNKDKSDYEKWYARYDEDGEPDCLMGRKQYFWRRKKEADCRVGNIYKEPIAETEGCKCQDQDFECDFNFVRDFGKCVLVPGAKLPIPPGECKNPKDKYKGPSGYRKIPGNQCEGGETKDEVQYDCDKAISTPSTGKILSSPSEFDAKMAVEYFYLEHAESSSKGDEETIIMMTDKQELWISHDGGKKWERILKDVKIIAIYPHTHSYNYVYFITNTEYIHYTDNRGHTFNKMKAPKLPNRKGFPVLDFHPRKSDWLIWHGEKDCDSPLKCHTSAWYTTTSGEEWHSLKAYSGLCKWVRGQLSNTPGKRIFCEHETKDSNQETMELLSSDNFFVDEKKHFGRIRGFATMEEFIVVAGVKDDGSLKAFASIDGENFADAHFPHGFNVPHQTAYTVLDSVTHSVFLHVTVNDQEGHEFGSLLKSNSNGTNYVLSLDAVNRNEDGYVDFEKMKSMEGIAIVNRVANWEAVAKGEKKKLRTMITHNDGGIWKYIPPPGKDSEGKSYKCSGSVEKCSLNLHHYTERSDPRHTFSSGSAIGLMMGVGNVGDSLKGFADGDTFLTTDGGLSWKEARKGQHLWEYGDQGSIIVIVDRAQPTDKVLYTLDEGSSWQEFKFGEKMRVTEISTVPDDDSRGFLLWGYKEGGREKFFTVHLNFQGITSQQCILQENKDGSDNKDDDFFLWSPQGEGHCLFGHESQFHRKLPDHRCYIGRKLERFHKLVRNCTCVAQDYECDFNYARASDNTCKLIEGFSPPDHKAICDDKNVVQYYKPTGYRRLPATTCEGGNELDKIESIACPGKEDQWKKQQKGLSGFGLFIAILIPIAAACGIGYYVWTRLLDGRFGAIRLGEDNESAFVQYPIIIISGIVAVAMALPGILSVLGSWVGSKFTRTRRYTTRSSFSRGNNYSIVNNDDEGELLGSDDDEDI